MTTATAMPQLTVDDRCDRCGAQAYVKVRVKGGTSLLFCVHHYNKHSEALASIAQDVVDESDRLQG
ncbi:MAG: hypothetical protein K0U64_03350 [Actinomycetia bacterium]|nr:hypothetical protein [Actinomycetes bacterium]